MDTSYSDYWLEDFEFDEVDQQDAINTNLIKLSMARRAISNFVHILTNKNIPVFFNDGGDNFTDGKSVYISSDIVKKEDFDTAVGLALHEGSHVVLSDFDIFKTIWQKVPNILYKYAEKLQISKEDVHVLTKNILNYIEDRYIDNFVYKNAPGYRGYYTALYDTYFNSPKIDEMLRSQLYRTPSIASYESRIINFNNVNTDLEALTGLRDIAKLINLSKIDRLTTPTDRLLLAYDVCEVILKNVTEHKDEKEKSSAQSDTKEKSTDDSSTSKESKDSKEFSKQNESADDVLGGDTNQVASSKEDTVKDNIGNDPDVSVNKLNKIKKALEKQKNFLGGNIKKKKVTSKEKKILDSIDKSGITLSTVGSTYIKSDGSHSVDCIVVKKMNYELLSSELFPLTLKDPMKHIPVTDENMTKAVNLGIIKGTVLGRKLQLRNESNTTKYMRKPSGRVDKRILSELSFENENIFYSMDVDKYNKSYIHISVDASTSMAGKKWLSTMTSVVAICKAASMIDNLRASVSFRTTFIASRGMDLPYVVIAYDSDIDKISKVKNLFKYIYPSGCTPEGLCYESIMNELPMSTEEDFYFLNFSDGQPYMNYSDINNNSISYTGEPAAVHTRQQVYKIRDRGYKILSYFIKEQYTSPYISGKLENESDNKIRNMFKTMYGINASFVNIQSIFDIAKTINKMFLQKN